MTAQVLVSTLDMERSEWLEYRKRGIGGSDAAAIAGLSPWKSPIAVWLEKTSQVEPEEPGEAAYWGKVLEDIVAQEFAKRTGFKVRRRNAILQHHEYPWMIANVDRLVVGDNAGLECKTTSAFNAKEWEQDEVPAQYLVQVQHYMAVTGYSAWWLAVLIGGNTFIYKKIERDNELIQQLIEIEKDFWENHVLAGVPPEMDGSTASTELLQRMYPEGKPAAIDLPSDAGELIETLDFLNEELKALEERKAECENRLKAMLGENEAGRFGERLVTWKNIVSNRFDSKTFAKDYPELYEKYLKTSKYRKFAVK
ncbi:MAG: hypothetical protein GXW85_04770 [Clostridia bacterium]|nr:hypothetical protein [Clostridia bacterium]